MDNISHMSQFIPGGIKFVSHDSIGRGKFEPSFLPPLSHVPFPVADFAFNSFAIINYSCEYDYVLSLLSPPGQSPNLGVILGPMKQKQKY